MRIKTILAAASMLAVAFTGAQAQTTGSGTPGDPYVVNLTGATAFRAASHSAILALLGGTGVTQYAFTGTQGLSGSNRAIFKGTIGGSTHYIVRTSWSGSTQGILDVADGNAVEVLVTSTSMTTAGDNVTSPTYENGGAVARWAFSDVDKLLSTRPNADLGGGPVGVVPFMFVMGEGGTGMVNMTDQIHNALWSQGSIPADMLGGPAGTLILATGRNDGSGTRATILAETGYGAFTPVVQWNGTFTGTRTESDARITTAFLFSPSNGGHGSNSGVRELLTRNSAGMTVNGNALTALFCSYLTISDAEAATGSEGAIAMTYNGVPYSVQNVTNGRYTLWGYQQLYRASGPTAAEDTFDAALRAGIPANMGTAGIPIPAMLVTRFGGDGGVVLPNSEE
jgi:hypothetical protein